MKKNMYSLQYKLKDFNEIISEARLKEKLQAEGIIQGRCQTKVKILYYIKIPCKTT